MRRKPLQTKRMAIAYCRVSSAHSESRIPKSQRKVLEPFWAVRGVANIEYIEEVGGGLNLNRPGSWR
jgi:putative resolvase